MQQVQDQLNYKIETPSDEELAKRFAKHQEALSMLDAQKPKVKRKTKKRKGFHGSRKSAKKLARAK